MASYFKEKRVIDKKYLQSAKERRCAICYSNVGVVAHHLRSSKLAGIGCKAGDDEVIFTCDFHHKEIHNNEKLFVETHAFIFNNDIKQYCHNLYQNWLLTNKI